nr:unnamed protein product [Callosobruchus chinensis]
MKSIPRVILCVSGLVSISILSLITMPVDKEANVVGWSYNTTRNTTNYIPVSGNWTASLAPERGVCDRPGLLVMMVCSAPMNFDARQAIRDTWGADRKVQGHNMTVYFLVGETNNVSMQVVSDENATLRIENSGLKAKICDLQTRNKELLQSMKEKTINFDREIVALQHEININKQEIVENGKKYMQTQKKYMAEIDDLKTRLEKQKQLLKSEETEYAEKISKLENELKTLQVSYKKLELQSKESAAKSSEYKTKLKNAVSVIQEFNKVLIECTKKPEVVSCDTQTENSCFLLFQNDLQLESDQFGDIIQERFVDSYNNLTLKSIQMVKIATNHCLNTTRYLLKIDDDMFVNVPRLVSLILAVNKTRNLLMGKLICGAKPIKNPSSKWQLSKEPCEFRRLVTMHHFNPQDIRDTFRALNDSKIEQTCANYKPKRNTQSWLFENVVSRNRTVSRRNRCS